MTKQKAEKHPTPKKYHEVSELDFYQPLYKKSVVLSLTDSKMYSGTLEGIDRFHLILETKQGLILFSKHAIKYVSAGKKTDTDKD